MPLFPKLPILFSFKRMKEENGNLDDVRRCHVNMLVPTHRVIDTPHENT